MSSAIVDLTGKPFTAAAPVRRARAGVPGPDGTTTYGGMPGALFPYDASQWTSQEMGNWMPVIRSPDAEINIFRDRMVARSRDLVRNSGWASGGITRILDNVVGTKMRLVAQPDYRGLALRFGLSTFDSKWAAEFRSAAEALYRGFSESTGRWNDVGRQLTMGQQFRLAMRHKLIDGESLALAYWMPERVGAGGSDYATAFLLVDPDRLSNPMQMMDSTFMRGGVEIDTHGVPIAAHIRKAQQNDWYSTLEANTWERVEHEDDDGWRRIYHDFEHDRAGQHRGIGVFSSVLSHMKMLSSYYGIELQAATLAATFGTYVTSPYDPALVQDALGAEDDVELGQYQGMRAEWAKERPAMLNGVKMPTLFPGEKIETVAAQHPHGNFDSFAHEMLCVFAAATGVSVEQVTQDWSRTNYSSARASLMETWKTLMRRRDEFCANTATPMYGTWLWEAMDRGELPLPAGAPRYCEAPTQYSRAKWLGPARGYIDGVKEPQGAQLRMEMGLTTLSDEAGEQSADWEEQLDQREIEIKAFKERGIPVPQWGVDPADEPGKTASGERSHDPKSPNYSGAAATPLVPHAGVSDLVAEGITRGSVAASAASAVATVASQASMLQELVSLVRQGTRAGPAEPAPIINVHVDNHMPPLAVTVEPSTATVAVTVEPAATAAPVVHVAGPNVEVTNVVPPAEITLKMPNRHTSSEIERDAAGNIVHVDATETTIP